MNGNGNADVYMNVYAGNGGNGGPDYTDAGQLGVSVELNEYDYAAGPELFASSESAADTSAVPVPARVSTADILRSMDEMDYSYSQPQNPAWRSTSDHVRDIAAGIIPERANDTAARTGAPDYSRVTDLLSVVRDVTKAAVDITGNVARVVPGLRPALQKAGVYLPAPAPAAPGGGGGDWRSLLVPGLLVAGALVLFGSKGK
jgi:hypothetical protein